MRRFYIYLIFFEFLRPHSKCGQNGGDDRSLLWVESCKTLSGSLTKCHVLYVKMIFWKNHEKTMRHLQFKFHPDPTKSADTCHFVEKWMESFEMQPIIEMSIKCGLLFIKNGVPHFGNTLLVPASQITPFSALGKWKIDFLCKENENSLWRHCLPFQDTHMCTIWVHYHKLCHG